MPYDRKSLTGLRDQAVEDINAAQIRNASGTLLVTLLQKSVLRIVAYAQAGLTYELYGYLDWIARQAVPWTATAEFLEAWAALKGVYRVPATKTTGSGTWVAAGTSGYAIPAGSLLTRAGDGTQFVVVAESAASGTLLTASFQAVTAGADGNFDIGTVFGLSSPISGIQAGSTGSSQVAAGADPETDDSLRTRMLAVYAAPPQGGDTQDYIEWALAVPGVTRAWIAPQGMGAGTVIVYFMMDIAEAAHGGFPQGTNGVASGETRDTTATGDQLVVADAIYPQRPVTALVYLSGPAQQPVDFAIGNLGSSNTSMMQAAITAALTDMFLRLASVGGTINPADGSGWPAIDQNQWYAALNAIPGLADYTITSPASPITASAGALPVLGAVTFGA